MSRSLLPNLLDVSLDHVAAGQQQALLGHSTGRCSIRLGIDHHAPDRHSIRPLAGMGCWHPRCSNRCFNVSQNFKVLICGQHTIRRSIHHPLDAGAVDRHIPHYYHSRVVHDHLGSMNLCCPADVGRSHHHSGPVAVGVPTWLRSSSITWRMRSACFLTCESSECPVRWICWIVGVNSRLVAHWKNDWMSERDARSCQLQLS